MSNAISSPGRRSTSESVRSSRLITSCSSRGESPSRRKMISMVSPEATWTYCQARSFGAVGTGSLGTGSASPALSGSPGSPGSFPASAMSAIAAVSICIGTSARCASGAGSAGPAENCSPMTTSASALRPPIRASRPGPPLRSARHPRPAISPAACNAFPIAERRSGIGVDSFADPDRFRREAMVFVLGIGALGCRYGGQNPPYSSAMRVKRQL